MAKLFEIVIFTCSLKEYAEPILNNLEGKSSFITHRLYRDSCTYCGGFYMKDLNRLDRDLSKTIIVDNSPLNFSLQQANGISIKSWFGDKHDKMLFRLGPILNTMVMDKWDDVREFNKNINSAVMELRKMKRIDNQIKKSPLLTSVLKLQ